MLKLKYFLPFFIIALLMLACGNVHGEDLTLMQCIDIALRRNLNHKIEIIDYEISQTEVEKVKAGRYPRVQLQDNFSNYNKYENNRNSYSISLSQPVYTGGELTNEIQAAKSRNKTRYYQLKQRELQLERDVTQAYMRLLQQSQFVKIRMMSILKAKEQLAFVEEEYKKERRGKETVLRWQVLLNNFEEDALHQKNSLENRTINFNSLLEMDLAAEYNLAQYGSESFDSDYADYMQLKNQYSFNQITDMIYEYTLKHSPEVKKRNIEIETAQYELQRSRAKQMPKVDFRYSYDWLDGNTMNFSNDWTIGLNLRYPLFDKTHQEDIKLFEQRLAKSEIQKNIYHRDLKSLIRIFYANQISSLEQVILKRHQAEQAKQYFEQIQERYRQGKATDIDLIDAMNSFYSNHFSKVIALYNYYIERENLQALMGFSDFYLSPSLNEFISSKSRSPVSRSIDSSTTEIFQIIQSIDQKSGAERFRPLLEKNPDIVKLRDISDWTPLHAATYRGNYEIVRMLLEKGADINAATSSGMSPLYIAANEGSLEIVKLLVEKGADVNLCGGTVMRSPLQRAAGKGHTEIVKVLVQNGAKIDFKSSTGWTALHSAAESGYKEIVLILLDQGANVNEKNNMGMTPLDLALDANQEEVSILLTRYTSKKK
jgi:outer membrane protein TolC